MPPVALKEKTLEEIVLGRCKSFINMGVWPTGEKFRPYKWLENFTPGEREHALYLLNSFTYYNIDMSISLLRGSLLSLSKLLPLSNTITAHTTIWKNFLKDSVFVPVVGENPNVTDSGNILAAHLRRDLLIPEKKILTVDQLYEDRYLDFLSEHKRIVFFDDFVGSGQQFITMWNEPHQKDSFQISPLNIHCASLNLTTHYCAMIGTSYGADRIKQKSPTMDLHFAHLLQPNASPLHPDSMTWPHHLKATGPEFILNATRHAGVSEKALKGFHNLGLSLAFSFTIPDATLPIFRWDEGNWSPLMKKS